MLLLRGLGLGLGGKVEGEKAEDENAYHEDGVGLFKDSIMINLLHHNKENIMTTTTSS